MSELQDTENHLFNHHLCFTVMIVLSLKVSYSLILAFALHRTVEATDSVSLSSFHLALGTLVVRDLKTAVEIMRLSKDFFESFIDLSSGELGDTNVGELICCFD